MQAKCKRKDGIDEIILNIIFQMAFKYLRILLISFLSFWSITVKSQGTATHDGLQELLEVNSEGPQRCVHSLGTLCCHFTRKSIQERKKTIMRRTQSGTLHQILIAHFLWAPSVTQSLRLKSQV